MEGDLYYRYNAGNPKASLLAMKYTVPSLTNGSAQSETLVRNVYKFEESAMYSMCSRCTGINVTEFPDPWYYVADYYDKESDTPVSEGYYWFTRKDFKPAGANALNQQVSRILMSDSVEPSAGVKEIEFRSGRKLVLSEQGYSDTTDYDSMFVINAGCPKATCPIYADLIFILDNSGSVKSQNHEYGGEYIGTDWEDGIDFVKKVIDQFTFADDAAKGAIIQFNAPSRWGDCGAFYPDGCSTTKCSEDHTYALSWHWTLCTEYNNPCGRSKSRCDCRDPSECECVRGYVSLDDVDRNLDRVPNARTASLLGGLTELTASNTTLINAANNAKNNRPEFGNTCQGYGLLLAMELINASARSGYDKKPQPIVIVVTDGEDLCPVTTRERAEMIKKPPYNAHLIEIGVGLDPVCDNYDRRYLENISTHMGTEPMYYPVENYQKIHEIVEGLFVDFCDGFADNDCGSGCEGFCGCGKCFCPTCDGSDDQCSWYECDSDEENSDGCLFAEKECTGSDICTVYSCNDTTGQCGPSVNTSSPIYTEYTEKYQGECHHVTCDIANVATDGWDVSYDDTYCKNLFGGDECIKYECSRNPDKDKDTILPGPNGENTGCRLVEDKIAKEKEKLDNDALYNPGTGKGCLQVQCDGATGDVTVEVYCGEGGMSKDCAVCDRSEHEYYECVEDLSNKPAGTNCTFYECTSAGWHPYAGRTDESCKAYFEGIDPGSTECAKVKCYDDFEGGCKKVEKSCKCTAQQETDCATRAHEEYESSTENCVSGSCMVTKDETLDCNFTTENCVEKLRSTIDSMNTNDNKHCFEPVCDNGECMYVNKDYPDDRRDNQCYEWICIKENGEWRWDWQPTSINRGCVTDGCTDRVCDPDHGCNTTDKCMVHSNDCFKLTCEVKNGQKVCVNNSLLLNSKCLVEVCRDGKKYLQQETGSCEPNKCQNVKCVFTDEYKNVSECVYSQKDAPDNDKCKIWECDEKTGEWHDSPTCYDGLYCTIDKCWKGQCRFPDVACDLELNMDGYPCFQPKCKEAEGRYKCVRKLIPNAYIDICGRCIENINVTQSGSGSESGSAKEVDMTTECTGAPPKPVLTEGLAAAAIALIILAAVIVGAGIAASGVIGTKQLIERAKGANNQSAHTNPLFEDNDTEMSNPAFIDGGGM